MHTQQEIDKRINLSSLFIYKAKINISRSLQSTPYNIDINKSDFLCMGVIITAMDSKGQRLDENLWGLEDLFYIKIESDKQQSFSRDFINYKAFNEMYKPPIFKGFFLPNTTRLTVTMQAAAFPAAPTLDYTDGVEFWIQFIGYHLDGDGPNYASVLSRLNLDLFYSYQREIQLANATNEPTTKQDFDIGINDFWCTNVDVRGLDSNGAQFSVLGDPFLWEDLFGMKLFSNKVNMFQNDDFDPFILNKLNKCMQWKGIYFERIQNLWIQISGKFPTTASPILTYPVRINFTFSGYNLIN